MVSTKLTTRMGDPQEDSQDLLELLMFFQTGPGHFGRSKDLFDESKLWRVDEGVEVGHRAFSALQRTGAGTG